MNTFLISSPCRNDQFAAFTYNFKTFTNPGLRKIQHSSFGLSLWFCRYYSFGTMAMIAVILTKAYTLFLTNQRKTRAVFHHDGLFSFCPGDCHTAVCPNLAIDAWNISTTTGIPIRSTRLTLEGQCCPWEKNQHENEFKNHFRIKTDTSAHIAWHELRDAIAWHALNDTWARKQHI